MLAIFFQHKNFMTGIMTLLICSITEYWSCRVYQWGRKLRNSSIIPENWSHKRENTCPPLRTNRCNSLNSNFQAAVKSTNGYQTYRFLWTGLWAISRVRISARPAFFLPGWSTACPALSVPDGLPDGFPDSPPDWCAEYWSCRVYQWGRKLRNSSIIAYL